MNFHIQNFKCFRDQTIPLNDLTIFAGANAAGKSSVIHALLLFRLTLERSGEIVGPQSSVVPGIQIPLNNRYCLKLGNSSEVYSSHASNDKITFRLATDNNNYEGITYLINLAKKELTITTGSPDYLGNISHLPIFKSGFHYLHAERYGPRLKQELSEADFISTGPQGEYLAQAIAEHSFTFNVDEKRLFSTKDLKSPLLKDQLQLWINFIMPGVKLDSEMFTEANVVQTRVATVYSQNKFSLATNVGFGISYVLPIIVSALVAEKGTMMIIENPEAHLHPFSQSRIGRFIGYMAASGLQVIVETHSEHVINGIRLSALEDRINSLSHDKVTINFFDFDGESAYPRIESIVLNEKADLSSWPSGFFDQTQRDFAEMMKLKRK